MSGHDLWTETQWMHRDAVVDILFALPREAQEAAIAWDEVPYIPEPRPIVEASQVPAPPLVTEPGEPVLTTDDFFKPGSNEDIPF